MKKIPEAELIIMKIIWELNDEGESITSNKVLDRLREDGSEWARTTILTLIGRLRNKKIIYTKDNKRHGGYIIYYVNVDRETYRKFVLKDLLVSLYYGNKKQLIKDLN